MNIMLRPYITVGVALVGTSVLAAPPVTTPADEVAPPQSTVDVDLTSQASNLLLPAPLGPTRDAADVGVISNAIDSLHGILPDGFGALSDPEPRSDATMAAPPLAPAAIADLMGDFGVLVNAFGDTIDLVMEYITVNVPANLTKVITLAIDNPEDIPGLLSFMAHCLLLAEPYADYGGELTLLYRLTAPTIDALDAILPAPFGTGDDPDAEPGRIRTTFEMVGGMIKQTLAILPDPVIPPLDGPAVAQAAPEIPDVNVDDVTLLEDLGDPQDMRRLVRAVVADSRELPAAVVGFANGGIDDLQDAVNTVATTAIETLPQPVRASLANANEQVNGAVDDFQAAVSRRAGTVRASGGVTRAQDNQSSDGSTSKDGKDVGGNGATDLSDGNRATLRGSNTDA